MGDHVATAEVQIDASAEEVWASLTDPEQIKKTLRMTITNALAEAVTTNTRGSASSDRRAPPVVDLAARRVGRTARMMK